MRAADSHPDDPPFIFPFFGSNERRAVSIPHPADQMILSSVHSESVYVIFVQIQPGADLKKFS